MEETLLTEKNEETKHDYIVLENQKKDDIYAHQILIYTWSIII